MSARDKEISDSKGTDRQLYSQNNDRISATKADAKRNDSDNRVIRREDPRID